jgi:hypothetical protein
MSYYQGDYYQGDYYQGDPGLWSIIKSGLRTAGRVAGAAFGLPVAAAAGVGTAVMARATSKWGQSVPFGAGLAAQAVAPSLASRFQIPLPGPNVLRPFAALPGGAPLVGPPDLRQQAMMGGGGCCPSGFHFNKQPSTARATFGAPPGSICVRNRSMNVANPRALRRGLRRVSGFAKLAARARKDIKKAAKAV